MTAKAKVLEETINIALEAAEAANDAAAEMGPLQTSLERTSTRLELLRTFVMRSVTAALGAAVVMLVMGALIYFQTLANLRTATATQIEALAVFTENMTRLDTALDRTDALIAAVDRLNELEPALGAVLTDEMAAQEARLIEVIPPQVQAGLDGALQAQTDQVLALITDLEAAMTKLVAAGLTGSAEAASSAARTAPAAEPAPKPAPTRTSGSTPTKRRAPAPEPNPFSFP
ncbi:hypothetical protein DKT77_10185 [Meridianimarinicoccus roseus]|jgi:hypothetical protein|uniref:Uncharacterized protein n=1 Tax=Meridianimarinicoccus roseus TaxID=2072018 RepID=A0A2V2LH30_9RHOB|nr:hypothetical protein [Meridianimarinicoccus roseus]PWR02556.1 hypothetical protein DKT77_10185 [Meridianimarinicoccus roseus]